MPMVKGSDNESVRATVDYNDKPDSPWLVKAFFGFGATYVLMLVVTISLPLMD